MQHLVMSIRQSIIDIEKQRGPFTIKCLVANNPDDIVWDLVLVANWFAGVNEIERLNYLSENIMPRLDLECIAQFSGIITIDSAHPLAQTLTNIKNGYSTSNSYKVFMNDIPIINTNYTNAQMVVML